MDLGEGVHRLMENLLLCSQNGKVRRGKKDPRNGTLVILILSRKWTCHGGHATATRRTPCNQVQDIKCSPPPPPAPSRRPVRFHLSGRWKWTVAKELRNEAIRAVERKIYPHEELNIRFHAPWKSERHRAIDYSIITKHAVSVACKISRHNYLSPLVIHQPLTNDPDKFK